MPITPAKSHSIAGTSSLVGGPAPPPKPGDAVLNARDAEHPKTIKGGYQTMPSHGIGGVASQTTKNTIKNSNSSAASTSTSKSTGSTSLTSVATTAVSTASSFVPVIGSTLSELASKFKDTDDVTLSSKYYPQDQPLLARMIIHFPDKVDDMPVVTTTATTKSSLGGSVLNPTTAGQGNLFATTGQNLGQGTSLTSSLTGATSAVPSFGASLGLDTASSLVQTEVPIFNQGLVKQGEYLEVRPNNLLAFDHQRIINGMGGKFTVTLFDPQWDLIEKRLCAAKGYFRFKYGYTDSQPASFSPWYIARAFTYKIDFGMEGNTITISGVTTGYSLGISKTFAAEGIKGQDISEIAEKLAKAMGFDDTLVEPTRPVESRDGLDTTDLTKKIITFTGQSNYMAIISELAKYAVNAEGQGNYVFFIRVNETGKQQFHFHTAFYEQELAKPAAGSITSATVGSAIPGNILDRDNPIAGVQASEVVQGADVNKTPAFTLFRNKNSALIRFTPNWAMTIAQLTGGGGTVAPNIDVTNKNFFIASLDMNNNPQVMDNKSNIVTVVPKDYLPKESQDEEKISSFNCMVLPDRSQGQVKSVAQAQFSKNYPGAITATLEIFGTPNFYLTQKIAVYVFKPQGDNAVATESNIHWVSGFFRIKGIQDSIRAGKFTTVFNLISDGRGTIAPDKVNSLQSK